MLFISPPFGNYIHLPKTISIKGSYTLEPRGGLLSQIIKTLRYNYKLGGWVNKIGLRNKGLDYGLKHYNPHTDILSIAILKHSEIEKFHKRIPDNTNLEINISCPNTKNHLTNKGLSCFLNNKRDWCIIKLSPTVDTKLIDSYYKQGFRQFHCSNTIPVKNGGLSGTKLIPYNTNLIGYIKTKYKDSIVIAGGGIYEYDTLLYYQKLGADHFSISTIFFYPTNLFSLFTKYY